jgi:hypothetical protein
LRSDPSEPDTAQIASALIAGRLKLRLQNVLVNSAIVIFGALPIAVGFGVGSLLAGLATFLVSVVVIGAILRVDRERNARSSRSS